MATARQWIARGLMVSAILLPLIAIGMYVVNPFGVQSFDPRQRILGYAIYRLPSGSMLPTLETGAIVVSSAGYYRNHEPVRGDIVVFVPPAYPDQDWIKRLIGLPGDRIGYHDNVVSLNGKPLSYARIGAYQDMAGDLETSQIFELREDLPGRSHSVLEYEAASFTDQGEGDWIVPPGHYFMIGDNRDRSDDSRFWGSVPRSALKGKMVGRL